MPRTPFRAVLIAVTLLASLFTPAAAQAAQAQASPAAAWPASPDWQQYVQAPSGPLIYPRRVIDVTGDVTNPQALASSASGHTVTLKRTAVGLHDSGPDSWPQGTTATASSTHAACSCGVTFAPSTALDGDDETYWNSANPGTTDWLEISTPAPVTLPGLTITSSTNGAPVDFQIQTWDAATSSWVTQVNVTNNSAVQVSELFPAPVTTQDVRIYITLNQNLGSGQYSRIAAVYPYYAPPTSLVLDYGKETEGWPEFNVTHETGHPNLLAGYSETLQYLAPYGDFLSSGPPGVDDPNRYDVYQVHDNGLILNQFPQGGERYEMLTLTNAGSVTLSFARLRYNRYNTNVGHTAPGLAGYFVSSNDLLNKLWYDGAYTVNLSQQLAGTSGMDWVASDGALNITGGAFAGSGTGSDAGILKQGSQWTDYDMSFDTDIRQDQSGWTVRAQSPTMLYLLILDASNDTLGPPNTLQELVENNGTYQTIANVSLPFTVSPESWYHISTVASGTTVTTSVNGQQVASFSSGSFPSDYPSLASGTVGFREGRSNTSAPGVATYSATARFRQLDVTDPSGHTLYRNSLASQSAVNDFQLPVENELPLMDADAKRDTDQGVWSGDMSVEGPTDYYAVGAPQFMKGALELLGSYQLTSGFVTGYEYPTTPVNTGPLIPGTVSGYSASYSMYWVANLATYYLFTGDLAFVRQEWPIVQRELAWNATQVDGDGLLVTNGSDGADWHYDVQTGEQTYYNALYYRVLLDGAALADAVGDSSAAASYSSQAAALKNAINTYLFDPATGVYNISPTQTGYVSQDANTYAVLYGIAPASTVNGILSAMEQQLSTPYGALDVSSPAPAGYNQLIGPFMGSYELWALLSAHQTQAAFSLLQQEWGAMTTTDPGDTFWEAKGADGTHNNAFASSPGGLSMAHGWATGPTSALSEYVLGVQPVAAGYRTWLVQPQPGSLSWAEGEVPTPHGSIVVKWGHETSQGQFAMQVQPPAGTSGTIDVPASGTGAVITVNGSVVWDNGQFHAAPGITAARLDGSYVALSANPAGAARTSFLIGSQAAGRAAS